MTANTKPAKPPPGPKVPTSAQLMSLSGVVMEMAEIYRAMRSNRMKADLACKAVYILREIRAALEADALARLEAKLADMETAAEARRNGIQGDNSSARISH